MFLISASVSRASLSISLVIFLTGVPPFQLVLERYFVVVGKSTQFDVKFVLGHGLLYRSPWLGLRVCVWFFVLVTRYVIV